MKPDLPERIEAIAETVDDWNAPLTAREDLLEAAEELRRLRAALKPFAAVAKGIPSNWPGKCRLRENSEYRDPSTHKGGLIGWHQWLSYWGEGEGGTFPTIDEWRAAATAAGGEG